MERLTERELRDLVVVFPECKECRGGCGNCKYLDEALYKLKNYEDLEEQGLLLKLPCKVGDTICSVEFRDGGEIILEKVDSFKITGNDIWVFGKYDKFIGRLGGSVFATKEEAEAKLKELENE